MFQGGSWRCQQLYLLDRYRAERHRRIVDEKCRSQKLFDRWVKYSEKRMGPRTDDRRSKSAREDSSRNRVFDHRRPDWRIIAACLPNPFRLDRPDLLFFDIT